MVKINGQSLDIAGLSVLEYLTKTDYDIKRIAVEINEELVPKSKYSETILSNGDNVEIVSFVGGG